MQSALHTRRSRRLLNQITASNPAHSQHENTTLAHSGGSVSGNESKSVFLCLPDEMFIEILSWFPRVSYSVELSSIAESGPWILRHDTLVALSETCRRLRSFFRPYAWQRIDVCPGIKLRSSSKEPNDLQLSKELVRKLKIVKDPTLAIRVEYDFFFSLYFCSPS
jgi:hypothetical protein